MNTLIIISLLVGLLAYSSEAVDCRCKCCDTEGCDVSKAKSQYFDAKGLCNAVTCNQGTCAANFKSCPLPISAGNVDSKCGANAIQTSLVALSAVLVGTFMAWKLY